MGAVKLTDAVVAALTCPTGRKDVLFFDTTLKGFGLRVTAKGARVFLYQYRLGATVRRQPLGRWPETTAAAARRLAEAARGRVRAGDDTVAERKARHAATIAAEAETRRKRREDKFTLGALIDTWEARHLATMRESYRLDATGRLRRHLTDMLDRPAASITRPEVVRALDRIAKLGETTARRVMGYARSAYTWAQKRELVNVNPFDQLPAIGREVRRDRVLAMPEVAAIWGATGDMPWPFGPLLRVLLLTAQRRNEVAEMRWSELSADRSTWTIPKERSKNGRAHVVHLAQPVRDILASAPRINDSPLVFTTTGKTPVSGFSRAKRDLDAMLKIEPWRLHDFRRTAVTWMAENGVPPHVADRILNHVQGTISGVAAVYQRGEFLAERRAALERWAGVVVIGR